MKTYLFACMFIACLVIGCSEEGVGDKIDESPSLLADYTILLQKDGLMKTVLLNADSDGISVDPDIGDFPIVPVSPMFYKNDSQIGFYSTKENCSGSITVHDFGKGTTALATAFTEDLNCDRDVKSIAFYGNKALLAYTDPKVAKKDDYYVRILDLSEDSNSFKDVSLSKKPIQLLVSSNKAFDADTMILGVTTNYMLGKEPKFGYAKSEFFGEQTMYYPMEAGSNSSYPHIAAVYDFKENLSILYIFENFLSLEERNLKYEIEDTTMVSYDAKNNLILIGYSKKGSSGKGGLMRIKPIPDPKFVDNINLDGIPMELFPN